jgi:hypothetical protein
MSRLESDVFLFPTTTASKKNEIFYIIKEWLKATDIAKTFIRKLKNTFKKIYLVNIYVLA